MFRSIVNPRLSKSARLLAKYTRRFGTKAPKNVQSAKTVKPEIPPKPADGIKPPNANATMNGNQQVQNPVQKKKNGHWGLVMAALIVGTPAAIYVALKKSDEFYDYCNLHYPGYISYIEKYVKLNEKKVVKPVPSEVPEPAAPAEPEPEAPVETKPAEPEVVVEIEEPVESPKVEIEEPLEPEETIEVPAENETVEVEEKVPDQVTETLMLQETIGEMESVAEVNAEEKQMEMEKEVQEFVETMAVHTEEEKEIEVAEGEIVNVVEAAVEEEMVQVDEEPEEEPEQEPEQEPEPQEETPSIWSFKREPKVGQNHWGFYTPVKEEEPAVEQPTAIEEPTEPVASEIPEKMPVPIESGVYDLNEEVSTMITDIKQHINDEMEIDIDTQLEAMNERQDALLQEEIESKIEQELSRIPEVDHIDETTTNSELLSLIKELKEELHNTYKSEGAHLYEALQKQKEELLKQAEEKLIREREAFEAELEKEYEDRYNERVEELEEEYDNKVYDIQEMYRDAIEEYKENSEKEYEGKLLYVEAETINEWKEKAETLISEYEEQVSKERHQRIQELNAVNVKLDELLESIQKQEQELEHQKTINSISRIILSMNHNMYLSKPLEKDMEQLSIYAQEDPVIASFLQLIPEEAAKNGLPPLSSYLGQFEQMKDQVHVASRTPASSTFGGQILGHVTAKAIKSTVGLDEHDPLIILDKMEAALKSGNIEEAYEIGQQLQGECKSLLDPWFASLKQRIDIERGIEFLNYHILGEKLE